MDEHFLIEQLKQGDETTFKSFVEKYQQLVFNTAIGMLQNAEDAEDIAQEVFIQVYSSIRNFKADAKLSTWLYRITINKSLDFLRQKKSKKRYAWISNLFIGDNELIIEPADFCHPGIITDNKERATILFRAIARLPEKQRTAFTLHKIEHLAYQQVAEIMDLSLSSIESLMHRAKTNLKKMLHNEEL